MKAFEATVERTIRQRAIVDVAALNPNEVETILGDLPPDSVDALNWEKVEGEVGDIESISVVRVDDAEAGVI